MSDTHCERCGTEKVDGGAPGWYCPKQDCLPPAPTNCLTCDAFVSEAHLKDHAATRTRDSQGRHDSYLLVVDKLRRERETSAALRKFAVHVHGALSGWSTTGDLDHADPILAALLEELSALLAPGRSDSVLRKEER